MEVEAGGDVLTISMQLVGILDSFRALGENLNSPFFAPSFIDLPVSACMLFCSVIPLVRVWEAGTLLE